jgi:TDG/mug DNA glycosylase family protein
MSRVYSFEPIANIDAKVLILGSMPGAASLRAGEYYAHPRNHFWRLLQALTGLDPASSYALRIQALQSANIALWDVLHSCSREGSMDASIDKTSQTANDFQTFFAQHPGITHVFFNGSAAERIFRRVVLPTLKLKHIEYMRLPSSSPANASFTFERKLEAWKSVLSCLS